MQALWIERSYPYALALALSAAWAGLGALFPREGEALFGAAVTVASVFGGFLVASKAVVLSLKGSAIFEKLRASGYMDLFLGYLKEGINASILVVVFSMVGFFIELGPLAPFSSKAFCFAWIFTSLAALLTYWRVSNLLFKMLRHA
jgi:hypothetical protein